MPPHDCPTPGSHLDPRNTSVMGEVEPILGSRTSVGAVGSLRTRRTATGVARATVTIALAEGRAGGAEVQPMEGS